MEHASRRYMVCQHCDTIYFLDSNVTAEEGVQLLNRYAQAHCGRCQSSLRHGRIEDVDLLFCEKCRGVLFYKSPFQDALARRVSKPNANLERHEMEVVVDSQPTLPCPLCLQAMDKFSFASRKDVVIDGCNACDLVWLDLGEFSLLSSSNQGFYDRPEVQSKNEITAGNSGSHNVPSTLNSIVELASVAKAVASSPATRDLLQMLHAVNSQNLKSMSLLSVIARWLFRT